MAEPEAIPALNPDAAGAIGGQPGAQFPPAAARPPSLSERLDRLVAAATEHEQAGRLDQAEAMLRQVVAAAPQRHGAIELLGIVNFRKGRLAEAAQFMERALALAPQTALYSRNLCEVYRRLGRFDEALAAGRRAAALAPNDPHCYHNLSVLHYHRLELDDAIAAAERAAALDPNFAGAHFGIAEASLLRADFARGWEEYEWRFKLGNAPPLMPPTDQPQWDGSPLPGRRLLLVADQGYGDVIQFARYIPWARERCADIAVACSAEIEPIVTQLTSGDTFSHWEKKPDFAAFCALSGLPRLAQTRLDTIPAAIVPYLRADPTRVAPWRARLAELVPSGHRRIAVAWAGRATHHNDRNRSTPLATFAPLAVLPRTTLLSLQKGEAQAQIGTYWGGAPLVNLGPEIRDFADTMAILECLDLVVSVDTSVAHLAGAMGRPAWVVLPYAPDWRWLLGRDDSPWYPSLRLFRQGTDRSYAPVMQRIAAELGSAA